MNHHLKLLEQVPPILLPKEITSARLIKGGLNNRNILVNESWLVKEYLIRDEPNDPVYLRFLREKDCLLLLQHNQYAPQLLKYYEDGNQYFITRKWIEGQIFSNENLDNNLELLKLLVNAIISIHRTTGSLSGDFHYYDVIKRYLLEYKEIERQYPTSPSLDKYFSDFPAYEKIDWFFNDHIHQLQRKNSLKALVRIHGDLVFSNIILIPKTSKIALIDWEYSTLADPCIDLAYFITQNQLSPEIQQTFIEQYQEKLGYQILPEVLKLTCDLMDLMAGLWYVIQAARLEATSLLENQPPPSSELISIAQKKFRILSLME
ncbi:MAG: phosphotransferase [Candidatus Thorarchaeota archaeon]